MSKSHKQKSDTFYKGVIIATIVIVISVSTVVGVDVINTISTNNNVELEDNSVETTESDYTIYEDDNGRNYMVTNNGVLIDDIIVIYTDSGYRTEIYIKNESNQDIKYIRTLSTAYNRVFDPVQLDYKNDNQLYSTFIGPIEPLEEWYYVSDDFNGEALEYIVLNLIEIEYMDGTTEILDNLLIPHKPISRYDEEFRRSNNRKYTGVSWYYANH